MLQKLGLLRVLLGFELLTLSSLLSEVPLVIYLLLQADCGEGMVCEEGVVLLLELTLLSRSFSLRAWRS